VGPEEIHPVEQNGPLGPTGAATGEEDGVWVALRGRRRGRLGIALGIRQPPELGQADDTGAQAVGQLGACGQAVLIDHQQGRACRLDDGDGFVNA
jgi:hypothetical protein